MLGKPRYGWTNVEIGDFVDRASYITDVPNDCLDAFIFGLKNGFPVTVEFDAEGWEFTIVSKFYDTFIIMEKEEVEIITTDKTVLDLAEELIEDIELHIDDWSEWSPFSDEKADENKDDLMNKLNELKDIVSSLEKIRKI